VFSWLAVGYAASYLIYINVRQDQGTTDEKAANFSMFMALLGPLTAAIVLFLVSCEILYRLWKSNPISKIRKILYGA
jgi:hypothetical protein